MLVDDRVVGMTVRNTILVQIGWWDCERLHVGR